MAKDLIGRTLGPYQITEQIGKGGMATIYKAYQPSLEREVAIKVLPPYYAEQDESFIARFKREAKAIANLQHQNMLMVMDTGQEGEYFYIVMEYIAAGTLKDLMTEKTLTLKEISNLIGQMADALDYAHQKGVIHRDIKPSNILMRREDWALLTDFGLAKMVGGSMLTQSGMTVGTPAYMSPEQGRGADIDARTDIYSLGVMLYEMVIGEVPYIAETPMAVVIKHITEPLPMPRSKNPNLPEEVQRIILKSLAKDPEDRYQSAGDLARALKEEAQKMPDWSSAEIPTVLSDQDAPQISPSAPTVQAVAPAAPTVQSAAAPEAVPAPAETIKMADADVPQASAPKKRNPWLWAAIGLGIIALLFAGIFGTIALINGQSNQGITENPPATQSPPPDQPPADAPDNGSNAGQSGAGLGTLILPAPPSDDIPKLEDPWNEALDLLDDGDIQRARTAFYQALLEEPFLWEDFLDVVDDAYFDHGPEAAGRLLEFGMLTRENLANELDNIVGMAYMQLEGGHPEIALQTFTYVLEQDPLLYDAYYGFYYASSEVDKVPEGIRYLQNIAQSGVENPGLFNVLSYMFSELGEFQQAVTMQQRALDLEPNNPWFQLDLATALIDVGHENEARQALTAAAALAEQDPYILDSIGWAFMEMSAYREAAEAFSQETELLPDEAWGYVGLAWALLEGDQSLSRIPGLVTQAAELASDDANLLTNIGWIYEDLDDCRAALPYFEAALVIEPGYFEAEDGMAACSE